MIKKTFKILNKYGLHARPAAMLVKTTSKFKSKIEISKDGLVANAKSIIGVMTLAAETGSEIEFTIDGEDAELALEAIADLIENKFYEESD